MLRYGERLPYRTFPTLGEGGTPFVSLPILAKRLQVQGLWMKNGIGVEDRVVLLITSHGFKDTGR
ncbi:hypothetical protein JCM14720_13790 [Calditerricola yamamurae]|nr:hypothetical protein [Bacillota bacterium]